MAQPVSPRGPGKFRQLRDYRKRKKPSSTMTVYFVEPDPRTEPSVAAELRASLSGLSDRDLRGLNLSALAGSASREPTTNS
jgi:hypothetical protein